MKNAFYSINSQIIKPFKYSFNCLFGVSLNFNSKFQIFGIGFLIVCTIFFPFQTQQLHALNQPDLEFDTDLAFEHLGEYDQLAPLLPGSENSKDFVEYAKTTLENSLWSVEIQNWEHSSPKITLNNLIAKKSNQNDNSKGIIVLGAHYDARAWADKDPDTTKRKDPVPGINDGGSGVVVLLELARILSIPEGYEVQIVLFDAEDQGGISGWKGGKNGWIIGSTYFVEHLAESDRIKLALILDIVGDHNLNLHKEGSSNIQQTNKIWELASELGYSDNFLDQTGSSIIDDHRPFIDAGIPAVDIIQQRSKDGYDFFKWHHTTNDTIENVDRESLGKVGRTVEYYLETLELDSAPPNLILSFLIISGVIVLFVTLFFVFRKKLFKKLSTQIIKYGFIISICC
jgi:Iap family predicted aminopeptidase